LGKSPLEGYPSHPPPHCIENPRIYTWKKRGCRTRTRNPDAELGRGERGRGGGNNAKLNNSSTDQHFEDSYYLSSPYCVDKMCLLASLASKNRVLYSEGRAFRREPKLAASPQSTTLHSTGNTSVKNGVSRMKSATATHVE
jgi:hypothetical protein